jgi:hypothetical protein
MPILSSAIARSMAGTIFIYSLRYIADGSKRRFMNILCKEPSTRAEYKKRVRVDAGAGKFASSKVVIMVAVVFG